jgi:hypothetical protein
MSQYAEDQEDQWYANLDNGEVRLMTLEELDRAFQNGEIHERTLVVKAGDEQWQTLAEVAGIDEDPAPAAAAPWPPAVAPAAVATSWPPAVAPASAPFAPSAAPASFAPPPSAPPHSMAPVVQDLPVWDLDAPAFKPKRTGLYVALGAVALAVAGISVAIGSAPEEAPSAALESPPGVAVPKAAAAPAPEPARPSPAEPGGEERFSEEMKQALLAADEQRQGRVKQKRGQRSTSRRPNKSGSVFTKGGSAYDPMNGSL